MNTPILFIIFNRLDTTKLVFEQIKKAKPPRLYLASDGPREYREGESKEVKEVREYVLSNIDWSCGIKTLFCEKNLGPKKAVSKAITWFFENEEMGIILEHDTLPVYSFFQFCEELLEKYKYDERVGLISGFNPIMHKYDTSYDYVFTLFNLCWGWATWRRVWNNYDISMSDFPDWVKNKSYRIISSSLINRLYWKYHFELHYLDIDVTSWDAQLSFMLFKNEYLSILPKRNLIKNIGYNSVYAVHCIDREPSYFKLIQPKDIEFPLRHNPNISRDMSFDELLLKQYWNPDIFILLKFKLKLWLNIFPVLKSFKLYYKFRDIYRLIRKKL